MVCPHCGGSVDPAVMGVDLVVRVTERSLRTIRRLIVAGKFPQPIRGTEGKRAWRAEDIEAWRASQPVTGGRQHLASARRRRRVK